ncbi:MAG: 1-deoxy-D-xylulose-5-phosphate reductoisomerase [Rickettsiales bacterium]|nr:1-deoxy-D-xylulose-5-phosphate reductoisomerase [Rickettsiales bacterium]
MHEVEEQQKHISLFGATGTIGDNTLDVIRKNSSKFLLKVVTAGFNAKKLIEICKEFKPKYAAILDDSQVDFIKSELSDLNIKIMSGESGFLEAASIKANVAVVGISGIAGLKPTMKLIESVDILAIANKEAIVCGGSFLTEKIKLLNKKLVPVDSEHSALFQTILESEVSDISSIMLTASGGPFLKQTLQELSNVTPSQALKHPKWKMGAKNSIDSATMVNKGLEMIEAYYLFPVEIDQIKVVIHPESIVHCFVNYIDGNTKALLSDNDMKKSIAYAMNYPKRLTSDEFRISDYKSLTFQEVDKGRFSVINVVYDVLNKGGSAPIVFNAVNEELVNYFLSGKISFLDIVDILTKAVLVTNTCKVESIDHVYDIDKEARYLVKTLI